PRTPITPYRSQQVVSASTRRSWYFHCKEQSRNNGRSFLQPAVCIAMLVGMSLLRRRLELGEAFIEAFRLDRPHVDIDHFGELRGLLARRDRGDDSRRRRHAVGGLIERRQLERDRLLPSRGRQAGPAQADGPHNPLVFPLRPPSPPRPR